MALVKKILDGAGLRAKGVPGSAKKAGEHKVVTLALLKERRNIALS